MSGSLYTYIENTGVIVPDTSTLKATIQSEFTGALGNDLNVADDEMPQGLLITAETTARSAVVQNNALLANQINPNVSGGIFLEAICALSSLQREANTFTQVGGVVLAGVQSSPIASGTTVQDTDGNIFALSAAVTLDHVTGQAIGIYIATVAGPVTCATGALTIIDDVLGLETVTNPGNAVVLGSVSQSDEQLRVQRRNTLALQSVALREAITSGLWALSDVIGVQTLENKTGSTEVTSGVTLVARSFWACVDGGTSTEIGDVLLLNKSWGCDWNGAQSVTIVEPASGQSYTVLYDIPTLIPLVVRVTGKQGTYQGDPTTDIPNAIVAFATNQLSTISGFVVGQNASPFEISAAIVSQLQGIYISKVEISLKSSIAYSTNEIAMLLFQKATVLIGDIALVLS